MDRDHHERFQHMIDESLAGGISTEREQSLREHLVSCTPCQEYLSASHRVIAGLGGLSFEVDRTLNARAISSLRLRAKEIESAHTVLGRRGLMVSLAAVVLTMGGSFVDLQFCGLIASVFDIQRTQVQQGLLAFWILPSLCLVLLFPLLPLLSKAGARREEGIL